MKIGILVDSSSGYIEKEHSTKLIRSIPLHLIINDKDEFIDSPEVFQENDLIKFLTNGSKTTTSQASPGELMEKYDEMLKEFDHIVHMTIPANISGMHQTAIMIANEENYRGKVTVIKNSLAANCTQMLALKFAEMVENGVTEPTKFQEESDRWSKGSWIAIIPSDLQKMSKGGRANSLLIYVLKTMKTKMAIQWLEKPKKIGMGRTFRVILEKMIFSLKKELKSKFELLLVSLPEARKSSMDQIRKFLNDKGIEFREERIPTMFPWHAGIDTVGLIAVEKELLAKK